MAMILNAFVGPCIRKVEKLLEDEVILVAGVKDKLKQLQRNMKRIEVVLKDAERKRFQDLAVKNWLDELRDIMYDAENIIDLCKCKSSKLLDDQASSSTCRNLAAPGCFHVFSELPTRHKIAGQIKLLNRRLDDITSDRIFSTFVSIKSEVQVQTASNRSTCPLVEPNLVGKEIVYATNELVKEIIQNKEEKIHKIAIVGMGGIGKTTLAQKVFNDPKIHSNFNSCIWTCVSQNYSAVGLLKEILRNVGADYGQRETLGELSTLLASATRNKSLFLVLDDVWQPEIWTDILRTPLDAAVHLTILITTRGMDIAAKIGAVHVHHSELMSPESGLELLWKFSNVKEDEVRNLTNIAAQIVQRCGKLPLAIKAIARVLAGKNPYRKEWGEVLESDAWSLSALPEELRGAIYLSYDNLPDHLKQCFVYCSLYEEDSYMSRDDLVRFWVAEGFIEEKQGQFVEDTAEDYYYELIRKSLLQPDPLRFDLSRCKLHDIFRSLAQHLSQGESYCGDTQLCNISISRLRRATITSEEKEVVSLSSSSEHLRLRTLLLFNNRLKIDNSFFGATPYLRVLCLNWSSIKSIPSFVGHLIHLRLLDLDGTSISKLPDEIGSLINLQILNLQWCKYLHALPKSITRLISLRSLGLNDTPINRVPRGIRRLKFLNDLEGYPTGNGSGSAEMQDGWGLEELRSLVHLRRLDMNRLERATTRGGTKLLKDKSHLKLLVLHCSNQQYTEEDIDNIENVFEELFPPENLEDLSVVRFFGRKHPAWLGSSLSSIKFLKLISCINWKKLPPLGQLPNLRYLKIKGASAVTRVGSEFLGGGAVDTAAVVFPKLETFIMEDMPNWEEWSFTEEAEKEVEEGEEGAATKLGGAELPPMFQMLPHLHQLSIMDCPKLRALPVQLAQLTSLQELIIRGAHNLKAVDDLPFLSDLLLINNCRGLERVSNLPLVRELRVSGCEALRCVQNCDSLQQLWLSDELRESPPQWVKELQNRRRLLHNDELDLYAW